MIKNGKFTGLSSTNLLEIFMAGESPYDNGYVIALFEPLWVNSNKSETEKLLHNIPNNVSNKQWVLIMFDSEQDYNKFANKATDLSLTFKSFLNGDLIYDSENK